VSLAGAGVLACSVRDCGRPLVLEPRRATCAAGHAFDRARSGYWNLLQPQDRRALAAGDAGEAVAARARSHARGLGAALLARLGELAVEHVPGAGAVLLELGSGSGDVLASLQAATRAPAIGIDLSSAAAEFAARRFPDPCWVVANADRRLPVLDGSIGLVLSVFGRRNPAECARVLAPDGRALFVVPAADDSRELRALLHGTAHAEPRLPALRRELEAHLAPVAQGHVRETRVLDRAALDDLLRGSYRGQREAGRARLDALTELGVTLAADWVVCAPTRSVRS